MNTSIQHFINKCFALIVFILCINFGFSQNVKIIGNIKDQNYENVILSPGMYSKLIDSKVNTNPKNGYFEFNIQVDEPSFYYLYYKDKLVNLYLEPNKKVRLTIENDKKDNYTAFYEDLVKENEYFNNPKRPFIGKALRDSFRQQALGGMKSYFDYDKYLIESLKTSTEYVDYLVKLTPAFKKLYEDNEIDMAGMLYATYYPFFIKASYDSFIIANPNFLNIYNAINPAKNYENVPKYYDVMMTKLKSEAYLQFQAEIKANTLKSLDLYKKMYELTNTISDAKVKRKLQENILGEWVSYYGQPSEMSSEISDFVNSETNEVKNQKLKEKLVYLAKYEMGNPAPVFNFEDNGKNVRNLKEMIGRVVYVDVWASWCKPCIEEIPHLKKLYSEFKDNPKIQFLSISIDDNKENWEKALLKYQLDMGIQGIAYPGGFNSDFAKKYNIQSIPTYILIDQSSNIINVKAPKPSEEEAIRNLLNSILQ